MKLFSKIKDNPLLSFLVFLLILTFGAFVGVLFFECIETHISKLLGLSNKNETLKFLGISMGGILIALQALMSYKRANALEDTARAQADAANAQARATEEQAKANEHTEQRQRQERFRNAIEHLGHEEVSVRLGGAYELFHLAEDTEELRQRQTVLDILCAHIRQTTGKADYRKIHKSKPSEEVQSLLTLLFVQEYEVFKGCHVNLQESWLNGADLTKARLENATLSKAQLQKTWLREACLQGASLIGAHLQGTILEKAQLQGAKLTQALLQGAILEKAHLRGTILDRALLQGAFLNSAQLQEASLAFARLQGAFLDSAQLQGAQFFGAQMQGAKLAESQLQGAQFFGAQMQGAVLDKARLQGAKLTQALLQGAALFEAQMQGTMLNGAQMQGIVTDEWLSHVSFEDRIMSQIGKETNLSLSGSIFAGGLSQEEIESFVKNLSDEKANELREKLESHIGKEEHNEPPIDSGAITGIYIKEDAEQWIAEYEKAMSSVPKEDAN